MSKKSDYIKSNLDYLAARRAESDVEELPGGVLRRVIASGEGDRSPNVRSIVTVQYTGTLISGRTFDSSRRSSCAPAFRLGELIAGWQIALTRMHPGDRWEVIVPADKGYGPKSIPGIPGGSTLIFDIELLSIG